MSWILVAFIAYLFLAIANLFDKFLVDNVVSSSKAYAFIACLMGAVVILIAPWYLEWPGTYWLIIDLISGGLFAVALWVGELLGEMYLGFLVVAAFYGLLAFILHFLLYKWMKRVFYDYFIRQMLGDLVHLSLNYMMLQNYFYTS